MKQYVVGFLFTPDKKRVVLIQKSKPEWQKGLLNGVGGKIEEGETPELAIRREFLEETGITVRTTCWIRLCELITSDQSAHVYFFYSFASYNFKVKQATDEKVLTIPIRNIRKVPCIPNLRWLIPMCFDPQHMHGQCITNASMK